METRGGTGEVGVHIRSKESYHQGLEDGLIPLYTSSVCAFYEVEEPSIVIARSCRRQWGKYFCNCKSSRIVLNYPVLGVLLHELAHHVAWQLYSEHGHGYKFKEILQEIFDWWEV